MSDLISAATRRNWKRLKVDSEVSRLTSGANKRLSGRQFIPLEYVSDHENIPWLKQLLAMVNEYGCEVKDVLYTISLCLLEQKGLLEKMHVQATLAAYADSCSVIPQLRRQDVPGNEHDILGLIYQTLRTEGEKNRAGAYYTGRPVTVNMTAGLSFSNGEIMFDPCCGSGAFLLAVEGAGPEQLTGMDLDPLAVMIARVNLLCHFPGHEFTPRITCGDYLQSQTDPAPDYVITNPPWGAMSTAAEIAEIRSGETFSYFLVRSYHQVRDGGLLRFLLPASICNIKAHEDIRHFLLSHGNFSKITGYDDAFSGVMTRYISIELKKETAGATILYEHKGTTTSIAKKHFYHAAGNIFSLLEECDYRIIDNIHNRGKYTLADSRFALGIVTGNNKEQLKDAFFPGSEIIYTGKEITPYCLKPAVKYVQYDRNSFQQAAKEEYYRAPEKLLYRFISRRPVFAYDDRQSLCLNSANILIPDIPGISIKSVLALLNSEVCQYIYMSLYGDVKILKGNLARLPFPELDKEEDEKLTAMVDEILVNGNIAIHNEMQEIIYTIFHLDETERQRIKTVINASGRNRS